MHTISRCKTPKNHSNNQRCLTLKFVLLMRLWLSILACLAFSSPAVWCLLIHARIFHPCIFDAPAFSTAAFLVVPWQCKVANQNEETEQRHRYIL